MTTLFERSPPPRVIAAAVFAVAFAGTATAQTIAVAPAVKQRYVQGSWVNLREAAQPQARVVAQVPTNTVLSQHSERDGWCAVLYAGDARLGPPLAEPLQVHVACNLLADQPLTLAQADKDVARAFWVAPSPNRMRAYGNALLRPAHLELSALAKTHKQGESVLYPTRPEWEAAKKLMRAGVLLHPQQEIDRGRPVNPLDDVKLATSGTDYLPAVAPLVKRPVLSAIAPSYFRSHSSVALLHETDADGLAAVAGSRISVIPTGVPRAHSTKHGGPPIEFITGFWDVGSADLGFSPPLTVYAITHQGLVGARTLKQRAWGISNDGPYCSDHYVSKGFDESSNDVTTPINGYATLSETAEVVARLVLPGKLPPAAVKVKTQGYATSWIKPPQPDWNRPKAEQVDTAVLVHEIDLNRDGLADILRIDTPLPGGMSLDPIFEWRWYLNINGKWFRAGHWMDEECT